MILTPKRSHNKNSSASGGIDMGPSILSLTVEQVNNLRRSAFYTLVSMPVHTAKVMAHRSQCKIINQLNFKSKSEKHN